MNTIIDQFQAVVEKLGNETAVVYHNDAKSYWQLNERANQLACFLQSENVNENDIVAICLNRGISTIVSILAILKCGAVYMPIDPGFPPERISFMLRDASPKLIITSPEFSYLFPADSKTISPESISSKINALPATNFEKGSKGDNNIYVLYTSGSTGKPKGVLMGQAALANLIKWQIGDSSADESSNTLQFAPITFDVSFQEIFSTLLTGGTLTLIDDSLRLDSENLLKFLIQNKINRLFLPFVALQMICETATEVNEFPENLKEVITAGEQLKITPQIVSFFSGTPHAKLFNQYGPTEAHVVTSLELNGRADEWPVLPSIGKPIDNTSIYILDEHLNTVSSGQQGELCIGGIALAQGYLNHPELSKEKFITLRHADASSERIYKTGDLARYLPDGNIEFLGRKDDQVKIRGYRIELGEIESLLLQNNTLSNAVVTVTGETSEQKRLIAYLISKNNEHNTGSVKDFLKERLPDYMLPSAFVWMNDFPKTSSGKIDKKALPAPELTRGEMSELYVKPQTLVQKNLALAWSEIFSIDKVGIKDNFFELGGNSILAQRTVVLLKRKYQYDIPVTKLYQYPTIAALEVYLAGANKKPSAGRTQKKQNKEITGVAIIGMECNFPGADTIEGFWDVLKNGKETIKYFAESEIDHSISAELKNDPTYVPARGVLKNTDEFDAAFFGIHPKLAELMDPQQRIFLETSRNLLEKTGYLPETKEGNIGVFAGCGPNTYFNNNVIWYKDKLELQGAFPVASVTEKDYISSRVSYELNLDGPAVNVNSACSTALLAVAQAVESIRNGHCEMAIAGGAAITVPVNSGHLYQEGAMLSNDGHTRTFDADAKGTVFSDGVGAVLLKSLYQAERDGDTIYAVIKGVGANNDGGNKGSFSAPSAEGQYGAIDMAIKDAQVIPGDISYIEAHGTATPLGDPIEIEGLKMAFGEQDKNQYCAIGSVKSNMGHLTHAAGVAGLIKTVLSLYHRQLPPSLHFTKPNPVIDFESSPFYVNTRLKDWDTDGKRIAGVSSFGVGGTNVHVIVEEYASEKEKIAKPAEAPQLITWSAKSADSLQGYAKNLASFIKNHPATNIADIAFTLQTTRQDFAMRNAIVATDLPDLLAQLEDEQKLSASASEVTEKGKDIVFMFPGQGSQYLNMGRELYGQEPVYKTAIDECATILLDEMGEDIRRIIFTDVTDEAATEKLKNTFYTQPAIFITSYAIAKLFMSKGIQPAALTGHSVGEFVAAHLAGVFSLADALKIVATRGRLISGLPRGAMLSVRASKDSIAELLPDNISVAAVNAPQLCVLSGETQAIEAVSAILHEKGIANKLLRTSHAFHSAMMDSIIEPLREVIAKVPLGVARIPILSTVTGGWLKDEEAQNPAYWAHHSRACVNFSEAVKTLEADLHPVFLEAGPGTTTSVLTKQHGREMGARAFSALDTKEKSELTVIKRTLGRLWQQGIEVNRQSLYEAGTVSVLHDLPTYAYQKKRLWLEAPDTKMTERTLYQSSEQTGNDAGGIQPLTNNVIVNNMTRKETLIEKIKELIEDASGIDLADASPESNFNELGLDSLLITQIASSLKKEFKQAITFRQLNEDCDTLNKLATHLDAILPANTYQPETPAAHLQAHAVQPATAIDGKAQNGNALTQIAQQLNALTQQLAQLQGAAPQTSPGTFLPAAEKAKPVIETDSLSAEEKIELKKPFGATARIETNTLEISDTQQAYLENLTRLYNAKTAESKAYTQKHRPYMADPRVVSGFRPLTKEMVYSIVVKKSDGCYLWDIDGNKYVDALNGFGSNFMGYQHKVLKKAIQEQVEKGYEIGPQHELAGEVSRRICEFTGMERAGLCNTGSEAVLGAMRIARTVSNRNIIVAFTGSYHGIVDEVLVRGTKKLKTFPAASGILKDNVQNMLILDYGSDESLEIIRQRADDIAGVLVEPVQSRRPEFVPVAFLKQLRTLTAEKDIALIFDEVITGFRSHPGGTQALFGIRADLATYGKIVGGGISIGIIAGSKKYMDALDGGFWQYGDDSVPEVGVTYFAGTFVRHPLALATALATLKFLKEQGPSLQEETNRKTDVFAERMNGICKKYRVPMFIAHFSSLWKIKFSREYPYHELLFTLMRLKNIHIWDGFPCFVTLAHTQEDFDAIATAFEESISELCAAGFIPQAEATEEVLKKNKIEILDNSQPPVPGAKLGMDADGNPAWFIEDKENMGQYLKLIT